MAATLSRMASEAGAFVHADGRLPSLENLDERTASMYVHNGVMLRALTGCAQHKLQAAVAVRRLVARPAHPPLQGIIDAGLVPHFVQFLHEQNSVDLVREALWVLINVASGSSEQTVAVARGGAVPALVRLLGALRPRDVPQLAVWALANIARDLRDEVLEHGALEPLLLLLDECLYRPRRCTRLHRMLVDKFHREMLQVGFCLMRGHVCCDAH